MCDICHDMKFYMRDVEPTHPQFNKLIPCTCFQAEQAQRRQARLTRASTLIGRQLAHRFGNYTTHYPTQREALAAAIANDQLARGKPALFVVGGRLMSYLRETFDPNADQSYQQRFREIQTAPLLILDDLGAENQTAWVVEQMFLLLDFRCNDEMPTVITSNIPPRKMPRRIAFRLTDKKISTIIKLDTREAAAPPRRTTRQPAARRRY